VEKEKHVSSKDLEDIGTSSAALCEAVASEERHMVEDDVLPTNPTSPLHNQCHIQSSENQNFTHCHMLSSGMDGIHVEGNAPIPGMGSINTYNPPCVGLQEVATHPVTSSLIRQLLKLEATMLVKAVCTKPPQDPTLLPPNPSRHVEAFNIVPSDDEFLIACV
jgi:hypothetical protein